MNARLAFEIFSSNPMFEEFLRLFQVLRELWHQYESVVLFLGMALILWRLRKERLLLGEKVDTLSAITRAVRDEAEAQLPKEMALEPAKTASPRSEATPTDTYSNHWEEVRIAWRNLRDRLELAIEGISRSSVRGKYSRMPRVSYRNVIKALEEDGVLSAAPANKLLALDTQFSRLKFRPSTTTAEDAKQFREPAEYFDRWLPRLPVEQVQELGLELEEKSPQQSQQNGTTNRASLSATA